MLISPQHDDWKSPEMIRAEYDLAAAEEQAYRDMYAADELLEQIEASEQQRAQEEAAMWEAHASRSGASPEWRQVAERVGNGEFSWEDVARGKVTDDPGMLAAIQSDARAHQQAAAPAQPAVDEDHDEDYGEFRVLY